MLSVGDLSHTKIVSETRDDIKVRGKLTESRMTCNIGCAVSHRTDMGGAMSTYILEEDLEHTASLLVDKTGDTLHTPTTGETTDGLKTICTTVSSRDQEDNENGHARAW